MTNKVSSYKSLLKVYGNCSQEVQDYFEHLPSLIEDYPYPISLAYIFLRAEQAQNRTLYCGVVKLHRANTELASKVINVQHLTRDGFHFLFEKIFGHKVSTETAKKIKIAESIRDKVIHGKSITDAKMREAIRDVLEYAELLNADVFESAEFRPFGSLRGFKGRGQPLDNNTTKWLLKGMGFGVKA